MLKRACKRVSAVPGLFLNQVIYVSMAVYFLYILAEGWNRLPFPF